jgi:hypothetical protein
MLSGEPDAVAAPKFHLALKLYAPLDARRVAVKPTLRDGLVDIPVAVPDDEILTERLRLDDAARMAEWLHILEFTYERGDLFTLQLHPERIAELGDALRATLSDARRRRPEVYIARLDDIATWWLRRSRFRLDVARGDTRRYRVRLEGDRDASLVVRGLDVPRTPWYGQDAISQATEFEVEAARIPIVAISRRSPSEVRRFLTEEGFPVEVSDDGAAYGAFVDASSPEWTESDTLAAVEKAPGPVVRIARWPRGARSALAITGDIDALTLKDFMLRSWETRRSASVRPSRS